MVVPVMTADVREAVVAAAAAVGNTFSMHTGVPGAAGTANEVTGGGYARKTGTWNAGGADGSATTGQIEFDVPGGITLRYLSCWSGSTFRYYAALPADVPIGVAGKYYLTVVGTTPNGA